MTNLPGYPLDFLLAHDCVPHLLAIDCSLVGRLTPLLQLEHSERVDQLLNSGLKDDVARLQLSELGVDLVHGIENSPDRTRNSSIVIHVRVRLDALGLVVLCPRVKLILHQPHSRTDTPQKPTHLLP